MLDIKESVFGKGGEGIDEVVTVEGVEFADGFGCESGGVEFEGEREEGEGAVVGGGKEEVLKVHGGCGLLWLFIL